MGVEHAFIMDLIAHNNPADHGKLLDALMDILQDDTKARDAATHVAYSHIVMYFKRCLKNNTMSKVNAERLEQIERTKKRNSALDERDPYPHEKIEEMAVRRRMGLVGYEQATTVADALEECMDGGYLHPSVVFGLSLTVFGILATTKLTPALQARKTMFFTAILEVLQDGSLMDEYCLYAGMYEDGIAFFRKDKNIQYEKPAPDDIEQSMKHCVVVAIVALPFTFFNHFILSRVYKLVQRFQGHVDHVALDE
jgi:hypothetical protein